MDKTCEILLSNSLNAEELLRNKGIRNCALEEWERSLQALPKTGKKHFEPNNSWLENVQIEKGLKTQKELLRTERVNRLSDLASAEWIPNQKKALVTKKSGQDWNNFGLEKNGSLYLIPEEALFLLEANCLELIWNGMPCSIQQAYEILIDNSVCTLDEYRVYSQLTRYGYRIQRYLYEESDKSKSDESVPLKRKVIVDPENGLRMSDSQVQQITEKSTETSIKNTPQTSDNKTIVNSNTKTCQNAITKKPVDHMVIDIMDQILYNVENRANINSSASSKTTSNNGKQKNNMNAEDKARNSKLEIISDETLLGNIKIVSETTCNFKNETAATSKWPGTRIQRNVKLLPKRSDKTPQPNVSIIDSACKDGSSKHTEKRKISLPDESDPKKLKHEVIELSDDEIQELPRSMTRMEMLNLLPNTAQLGGVVQKISKRYIPYNVRPQKNVYQYNKEIIKRMQENDRRMREKNKGVKTNEKRNTFRSNATLSSNPSVDNSSRSVALRHQHARSSIYNPRQFYQHLDHRTNIGFPYTFQRFPFNCDQNAYILQNRITLMLQQQNVFHNTFFAFENHENCVQQNRSLTIQMNNFTIPLIGGYRLKHPLLDNQCRHNVYNNFMWYQRFLRRTMENTSALTQRNVNPIAWRRHDDIRRVDRSSDSVNRPSFTTFVGVSSWTELKKKWCEEKTITIDDEDYKREEYKEEVEVVKFTNPLVSPKNVSSLAEIFNRLTIIKSAPEKMMRRKNSKYKISYNVYSCAHHYKKANPGQPMYSLVVIRKENSFLQPFELNRLQQDAKGTQLILACVAMSISYIQPGIISLPNVI